MLLLAFFAFDKKFAGVVGDKIFYLTNLLIVAIMLVAVYMHLHPNVPAETLLWPAPETHHRSLVVPSPHLLIRDGWRTRPASEFELVDQQLHLQQRLHVDVLDAEAGVVEIGIDVSTAPQAFRLQRDALSRIAFPGNIHP